MISFFFFKQKTAYDMRISDWSSDVCSSDLLAQIAFRVLNQEIDFVAAASQAGDDVQHHLFGAKPGPYGVDVERQWPGRGHRRRAIQTSFTLRRSCRFGGRDLSTACSRSEEHTSELQSLMRISFAVLCLKK